MVKIKQHHQVIRVQDLHFPALRYNVRVTTHFTTEKSIQRSNNLGRNVLRPWMIMERAITRKLNDKKDN